MAMYMKQYEVTEQSLRKPHVMFKMVEENEMPGARTMQE